MSRPRIAWSVALPVAVVGSQLAHWLGYRIATPDSEERTYQLAASGHGYLTYAPLGLALAFVLVTIALAGEVRYVLVRAGGGASRPGVLGFLVLAPAIFVCQEHLERLVETGTFPWDAAVEPTFVLGLLFQIPFALLGALVAGLLLRGARTLAFALRASARRHERRSSTRPPTRIPAPRLPVPALGYGSRDPPSFPS
jgi:hypothetical protein